MIKPAPPFSNAERQRQFRARHPGYFKKYRTSIRAFKRAQRHAEAAAAARVAATTVEPLAPPVSVALPAQPAPLMLPAPAELPRFPGMNTIEMIPARAA
jgi:hypothetical protein